MVEQEIPHADWPTFCEQFLRQHQGWLVSLAFVRAGEQTASLFSRPQRRTAHERPLRTLTAVPNPHGLSLLVETGDDQNRNRMLVDRPERLRLQQTDAGANAGLCVDTADRRTLCLLFRVAAHPETVNGLAETELNPP